MKSKLGFKHGLRDGVPIGLGYLSVSFGFGIMAVGEGLSVLNATILSLFNLTSAGQVAGLSIIASGGTYAEMALAQLVINMRYALMSLSLSQKLDKSFTLFHRFTTSFGITDEIFAVAAGKPCNISRSYMYGLMLMPIIGWTGGTFLGAAAGEILPEAVKNALGLAIYGMFIAIVIPPAKKNSGVLTVAATAIVLSCILYYVPLFDNISSGFSVIICAVAASVLGAVVFPVPSSDEEESE
ncbi:MAG: AzlC family ABC transporter permease [Oscillospiraceae bacterium]|nr:AzlC family ABC transporter permease [Oscillospiraceae bacterium]